MSAHTEALKQAREKFTHVAGYLRSHNLMRAAVAIDGVIEGIDAALSLPDPSAAPVVPQWLPIETAPKDFVTLFDGWNGERVADVSWAHPTYGPKAYYAFCVEERDREGCFNIEVNGLTHWMPLPPAPQQGEQSGQEGEQG